MDGLLLFLKIGLLIFSAISLLSYSMRKSDTKQALRSMDDDQVVRQLTPEEKTVLSDFIAAKKLNLLSDDVYLLTGEYSTHGIEGGGGRSTMHDVIGGVEVLFPFDMKYYLESYNEALVVRAKKQAIVIVLNGEDLLLAEQREQTREQQQNEWTSGKVGTVTPFAQELTDHPVDHNESQPLANEQKASSRTETVSLTDSELYVEILGQRDETPEEIRLRVGRGIGFLSATLWIIAVVLFIVAFSSSTSNTSITCVIAAVVLALFGFLFFFKKKNYLAVEPDKVNRARGRLTFGVATAAHDANIMVPSLFLGDKIPLTFPDHLADRLDAKVGQIVDLEARVSDNLIVSFEREWSITEEVQRFKLWYWGRYLLAALVGIFALIVYHLNNDSPYRDLSVVSGYYFNPIQHYTEAGAVSDPKLFSLIHLQGNARCEYSEGSEKERGFPVNDCASIRWGGELSSTEFKPLELDPSILSLLDGSFITDEKQVVRVPDYDRIWNNNRYGYGYYDGANNMYKDETHHYILDFGKSLQTVEQACEKGLASCSLLKAAILREISDKVTVDPVTEWDTLVQYAQPKKSLSYFPVTALSVIESLRDTVGRIVYTDTAAEIRAFTNQVLHHQHEGVVVMMDNSTRPYGQQSRPLLTSNTKIKSWHNSNIESYVEFLSTNIQNDQVYPFDFKGIVTGVQYELSGTPILELNTYNYDKIASDALARILLLGLGLILALGFGAIFFIALYKSGSRKELIRGEGNSQPEQSIVK